MPPKINYFIFMGDSLSDTGFMDHRKLAGIIPMDGISGLKGKSPKGSFTNGYVWDLDLAAELSEEQIIKKLKRRGLHSTDIADAIIVKDKKVESMLNEFSMDNYREVDFKHQDFVRYYAEGGLTSYTYRGKITCNLKLSATRDIVSTLTEKRKLLLQDDAFRATTEEQKKHTLITEWSGANDCMTVNKRPTMGEADKAVQARLLNIEALIAVGYENFVLVNLPNLSLTPRFQKRPEEEQKNAQQVCEYFNQQLNKGVEALKLKYPLCSMDVFDIATPFAEIYANPKKYKLDENKKTTPYTTSPDFTENEKNHTSPAPGYMFWDDVHPTANVHAILAQEFYNNYEKKFHFSAPHESLLTEFKEHYGQRFENDRRSWLGFFRHSRIDYKKNVLQLTDILNHALYQGGHRTR
jgi:hypothetical protein